MKNKKNEIIIHFKEIKKSAFCAIKNYENSHNEVANYLFLINVNYEKLLKYDLEALRTNKHIIFKNINEDKNLIESAYSELVLSLEKRLSSEEEKRIMLERGDSTIKRSIAQSKAYNKETKSIKSKDGYLYITGLLVKKEIVVPGNYRKTNQRAKTLIKKKIQKILNLKSGKYRTFKIKTHNIIKCYGNI